MASDKNAKKPRVSSAVVHRRSGPPWLTIGAVVVVVALIGTIFAVVYSKQKTKADAANALAPFQPTAENMDPSVTIPGIYVGASVHKSGVIDYTKYKALLHVNANQRVAYDRFPPVGGPHDGTWAACNGVVYPNAVRDENMVHPLEHGAIWITYNPDKIAAGDLDKLKARVEGKQFIYMSPYPTLDQPISLQAWAHQLKVQSADDPRIDEFITALQRNQYVYPETGATCDSAGIDASNAPAFDPSPRGSDAIPLDGSGLTPATDEMPSQGQSGASGVSGSGSAAASGASVPATASSAPKTTAPKTTGAKSTTSTTTAATTK